MSKKVLPDSGNHKIIKGLDFAGGRSIQSNKAQTLLASEDLLEARKQILDLEIQLSVSRQNMSILSREHEAANYKLQTANEELQCSGEEMRVLNDELQVSKEDLVIKGEELNNLYQELLEKQELLSNSLLYAEAIITTISEPLVIFDKLLRIKTANTAFYNKFNITPEDTEGKLFYEIVNHSWDNALLRSLLEDILPQKESIVDYEIEVNLPDVGSCYMLLNARQVINKKTAEQLILLAIEDITERKNIALRLQNFSNELEVKVKERTADLLQTNMQLQQFAHAASHDLQEPLRKILTFSNRLHDSHEAEISEGAKNYLNKIEIATARMSKLIEDLLNYSHQINHEKLFTTIDLNEMLAVILTDFELLIEQKSAVVKSDVLPVIEAIPLQINQLFSNLISNALKFTKDSVKPIITITSHTLTLKEILKNPALNSEIKYCELIFHDNGIGFEQKYGKQIFTIFQRLHSLTQYQGTGIGLALCKQIIDNHRGVIFAESTDEGTFFHIILPIKQTNALTISKSKH